MAEIKLMIVAEPERIFESELTKAVLANNWAVYSESDIQDYRRDLLEAIESGDFDSETIEKAKKDITKLVPKLIVDSIGRTKTVYVSPMGAPAKSTDKHAEAVERHQHNIKVQRMGKEASLKHIEKLYGEDVSSHVRAHHEANVNKKSDEGSSAKKEPTIVDKTKDPNAVIDNASLYTDAIADGEDVSFLTIDRKKIEVSKDSARGVSSYIPSGKTMQKDIEHMKLDFTKFMREEEDMSEKTASRIFHRWLRDGEDKMIVGSGAGDNTYYTYRMSEIISEMKKVSKRKKTAEDEVEDKTKTVEVGKMALLTNASGKKTKVFVRSIVSNGEKATVSPLGKNDRVEEKTSMSVAMGKLTAIAD